LYELDISNGVLNAVCAPPANIFGAASSTEFLVSDCPVLDLDKDNSSGVAGSDYQTTVCGNGVAFISDTSDAEVYSGYQLDSLRFVLTPAFPGEVLNAALPLPSGISISGQGSANPVLHNNGPAQYADFQSVLRTVTWRYTGAGNAPAGPRTVVATLFATGNRRDTASALLNIRTPVSAGRDSSVTVCADAPAFSLSSLLSAEAAAGGSWLPALPGGMFSPAGQPGGQFRYIVSGGECPPDTTVITIAVQSLPVFSFDNSTSLCTGDTLYLGTPLPAVWQDGAMTTSYTISQAGFYWAEVTDASGCKFRDSILISLIPVQHTEENIQRCSGQTYAWNGQVFLSDTTVCATFGSVQGCDSVHCITLDFLPPLTPPSISGDTAFCPGGSTTFSVSGFLSYAWSVPGATGPTLEVTNTGAYTVTATDAHGCTTTASRSATESAPIVATWDLHPPACFGAADGWIELLDIEGGTSPFSYRFNGDAPVPEPFFDNLPGGTYSIRSSGADGCFADTTLVLAEPPLLSVSLGPDTGIPAGGAYQLSAQIGGGQGALVYAWSPAAGLSCSDCPNPVATPSDTVVYVLSVTDANGCSAADSIRISVQNDDFVFVPNVFSPDDDGKNDFFGVFADPDRVRAVELLRVYDRWGTLVYETAGLPFNELNRGWNGTYRGQAATPGIYVWHATIRLINGEVLRKAGDVLLQR
jgi:gliding motility-associated-like protein